MKKKNRELKPKFLKNKEGKITAVFVPEPIFKTLRAKADKWEKVQKKEGVRWSKVKS